MQFYRLLKVCDERIQYLIDLGAAKISTNGVNMRTTKDVYKFMGFRLDYLKQYYRLADFDDYKIAKINQKRIISVNIKSTYFLSQIKSYEEFLNNFDFEEYYKSNIAPHKSMKYIKHRYFENRFINIWFIASMTDKP